MGRIVEVAKSIYSKRTTAPGKSVVLQTKSSGIERTTELYHPPGISSAPTKSDRVVEVQAGTGVRVAIASHNYRVEVEPDAGEIIIFSLNTLGDTLKSTIKLDNDGNIDLNGSSKNLITSDLAGLLNTFVASLNSQLVTAGAPGGLSLDISTAETSTIRTGG